MPPGVTCAPSQQEAAVPPGVTCVPSQQEAAVPPGVTCAPSQQEAAVPPGVTCAPSQQEAAVPPGVTCAPSQQEAAVRPRNPDNLQFLIRNENIPDYFRRGDVSVGDRRRILFATDRMIDHNYFVYCSRM